MGTSYTAINFYFFIFLILLFFDNNKEVLGGVELSLTKAIMLFCAGNKRVL